MFKSLAKASLILVAIVGLSGCKLVTQDGECYGFCPPWFAQV